MSATPASDDGEVTHLLNAPGRGDELDADVHHQRFSRVYEALHHIARRQRAMDGQRNPQRHGRRPDPAHGMSSGGAH